MPKPTPLTALLAAALISWSSTAPAQEQGTQKNHSNQAARSAADQNSVKLPGQLEAAPGVEIRSELTRPVSILRLVREGKEMEKGDLIAKLDSSAIEEDLRTVSTELAQAEADLRQVRQELTNVEPDTRFRIEAKERELNLAKMDREKTKEEMRLHQMQTESELTLNHGRLELAEARFERLKTQAENGQIDKSRVHEAGLELDQARAALERTRGELQLISKHEMPRRIAAAEHQIQLAEGRLEQAKRVRETRLTVAESHLQAQERVLQLHRDRLKRLEHQVAAANIAAPTDGQVVYESQIREGSMVRPGQPLLQVIDVTNLRFVAQAPPRIIAQHQIQPGQPAQISLDGYPNHTWKARVTQVEPWNSGRSRANGDTAGWVFVELEEKPSGLLPGLTGWVEIDSDAPVQKN